MARKNKWAASPEMSFAVYMLGRVKDEYRAYRMERAEILEEYGRVFSPECESWLEVVIRNWENNLDYWRYEAMDRGLSEKYINYIFG